MFSSPTNSDLAHRNNNFYYFSQYSCLAPKTSQESMKKIILSLIIFSFLFALTVSAEEVNLPKSGLTPDSNFYFFKLWKESIQTFFTFGAENKAKQFLHLAEVRLAEYQKMVEKGKTEIAEKTLEKYERQLNQALEKAEEAKEKGKNVEKLKEIISEKALSHQEVLTEVLSKVPEEAKKGFENAIEMSQKGFENAIQAVSGEKKEELEKKAEEVKTRIEEKIKTKPILMCGGIAGILCPEDYICKLESNNPDASGKCVIEESKKQQVCIQVITPAISPENVCKEFPTPCDVPADWKKVDKCPSSANTSPSTKEPTVKPVPAPISN